MAKVLGSSTSRVRKGEYVSIEKRVECIPPGLYQVKEVNTRWLVCQIGNEILFGVRVSLVNENILRKVVIDPDRLTTADEFTRRHNSLMVSWLPPAERQLRPNSFCYIEKSEGIANL